MKKITDLSDEEISRHMDFDGLLSKREAAIKINAKTRWFVGGGVVLIVVLSLYFFIPEKQSPSSSTGHENENISSSPNPSHNASTDTVTREIPAVLAPQRNDKPVEKEYVPAEDKKTVTPDASSTTNTVYRQAEPVDGYPSLYNYFNTNLRYPVEGVTDSIQGVLTVTFVINVDGNAESIVVQNSLGEQFEKEAIRLIKEMPRWNPALLNNKPVASKLSLPLTFQITEEKINKK